MMILWVLGTFAFVGPFFSLKKIKDYLLRLHWHKDKINKEKSTKTSHKKLDVLLSTHMFNNLLTLISSLWETLSG